ncbi:MAG TPA: hypothetical protein VME17_06585 [Bryobacteraceae bacterium]|nr:hypothetical protein [Bryobacteraceae bacterium]
MIKTVDSPWKRISPAFRIGAQLLLITAMSFLFAVTGDRPAWAQADGQVSVATGTNGSTNSNESTPTSANRALGGTSIVQTPPSEPTPVEASLFSSLFMAGKTQDQFKPLNAKERAKVYAKDLLSPFHFFLAGVSAGVAQLQDSPKEWGLGAQGYGIRFANYYGNATIANILQMTGEDLLHEDNLYYGSGKHGTWKRVKYAVASSVLARSNDGTQHLSISQIGSTAAASFISRIWQPRSSDSAGDGAVNFGINMASNAGVNVVREFLPGITNRIFHHDRQ